MPDASDVPAPNRGELRVMNPETITVLPWRPQVVPTSTRDQLMTREMVDTVVPDARSLVETCYAAALVVTPNVRGDFSLQIAVEPSGNVNRLETNARTPLNEPMRQCIITLGRQLQFPPSRAGAQVTIPVTLVLDEATPAAGSAPTPPAAPGPAVR
ncbi:MAG: AgmX/PglI C-terminal domain-containing protein [Polyangiales bacterium]